MGALGELTLGQSRIGVVGRCHDHGNDAVRRAISSPASTSPGEEAATRDVRIPTSGTFGGTVSFQLTIRDRALLKRLADNEASLHWVYARSFPRPFRENSEGRVPDLDGRTQVLIEAVPPSSMHGSMWPATIHVEER